MLHILFGEDDFSIRESLAATKHELGNADLLDCNTTIFDADSLSFNQLVNACSVVPFMTTHRLIIVNGLLGKFEDKDTGTRSKRSKSDSEGEQWLSLTSFVDEMPSSTVLVLVDNKISRNNYLLKKLDSKANIKEFPLLKTRDLHEWIRNRVIRTGCDIESTAVQVLAEHIGANLWVLSSEIEKLCLYKQGERIVSSDILDLVSYIRETNIFVVIDSLMSGNRSTAITQLHRMLEDGAAPTYLVFMITRQFRLLLQAKELISQRYSMAQVAGQLGIRSDYAIRKILEQARGYTVDRLKAIYDKILNVDIAIKTGKYETQLALDLLLFDLCYA